MAEKSFFHEIHQELDAKLVPDGKYQLPLFYPGGAVAEHRHTLAGASLFDRSGTGCFQIAGKDAGKKLDKLFFRSSSALKVGSSMSNFMLTAQKTFAAVFTLNRMQEDDFMLLLDREVPDKNRNFLLDSIEKSGLMVRDLSGMMAVLHLSGAKAGEVLLEAGAASFPENACWQMAEVADEDGDKFRCIVTRHDRFGVPGFDLCVNADNALEFYGALYRINGISPAGSAAWESLRLESSLPAFPGELHDGVTPAECGFPVENPAQLPSRLAIAETARHAALPGTVVKLSGGITAGVVTSGAYCPKIGKARIFCRLDGSVDLESPAEVTLLINGKEESAILSVFSIADSGL